MPALRILVGNCMSVSATPARAIRIALELLDQPADVWALTECSDFRAADLARKMQVVQFGSLDSPESALVLVARSGVEVEDVKLHPGTPAGKNVRARPILTATVDGVPLVLGHAPRVITGLQGRFMTQMERHRGVKVGDFNVGARLTRRRFKGARVHSAGLLHAVAPADRPSSAKPVDKRLLAGADHNALLLTVESQPTPAPTPEVPVARLSPALPAQLRAAGLKVVEHDGWQSHGRPSSTGGFAPVGVLCHHTATSKSTSDTATVRLLIRGRSDLPGPLCHFGLSRDGTVHVIAAGRANHAGKAEASGTVAAGDGNSLYIGIEAFNDGVGEKWPAAQYDAYVKLAATLCEKVTGNSAETVRGHKETSVTGKIDPTFPMDAFRSRVAALLAGKTETPGRVQPRATNVQALRRDVLAALKKHGSEIPANRISARTWVRALTALAKGGPKS